jgi:hypothetical protein
MKKQLLLLALALSTTSPVMSIFHGTDIIDFINTHGLETLTSSQQRDFKTLLGGAEFFHKNQINKLYPYQSSVEITPLMLAAYYVNPEMVAILLEHGADVSLTAKGNFGIRDKALNFASLVLSSEKNVCKIEMLNTLKDHTSPDTRYARTVMLLQDAESN